MTLKFRFVLITNTAPKMLIQNTHYFRQTEFFLGQFVIGTLANKSN